MARKKSSKPMSMEEFRETEQRVTDEAARQAMERRDRERAQREEVQRRRFLANRSMRQVVEAMMTPPDEVKLPSDFAVAWGADRAMFLKMIERPLTAVETKCVAGAMATLMEHNRQLRLLAKNLVDRLEAAVTAGETIIDSVTYEVDKVRKSWLSGEGYIDVEED